MPGRNDVRVGARPTPLSSTSRCSRDAGHPRADTDRPRRRPHGEPVADRVLDERLQNQMRHERESSAWLDLQLHRQPLTEARTLDVEVRVEARELFVERHLVLPDALERQSKQRVQLPQHSLGCFGRLVRELRDRVQTVEQEVRLKLKTEELQLRASQLDLEHVRSDRAIAVLPMEVRAPTRRNDHRVRQNVDVQPIDVARQQRADVER